MKKCFKCSQIKPLREFYRHKEMADGHLNKCKECTKKDVRLDRINSPNARLYDKKRYQENEERRRKMADRAKKWRREKPERYKAHTMVSNAVRNGKLIPKNCEVCGDKAHAHHDDYNKPLDVRWLCPIHHQQYHASLKA